MKKRRNLRDHLIPHRGNDYTPHALQRASLLVMLALVVMTFTAANLQSLFWMSSEWLVSTILPGVIVELTNEEREENGVFELSRNAILDEAARLKAKHMAEGQYFSHYSPEGVSPWHWFNQVAYNYAHAGENLAIHFSDSDEVVEAWMESPSHRENIVDGKFTEIGVGTARGRYQGYDTVFVVQLFGTPALPAAAPAESEVVVARSTETVEPSPVLSESIDIEPVPEPESTSEPEPEPMPEPEPNPEPVEEEDVSEPEPILALAEPEEPVIAEITVEEESVSIYSETIATSSGLAAEPPASTELTQSDSGSFIGSMATRPNMVLQWLYLTLGLFVLAALLLSIFIEIRHQRPVQIAYGLALLLLMSGLFYVHTAVTSGALIV